MSASAKDADVDELTQERTDAFLANSGESLNLQDICAANGISKNHFAKKAHMIERLEFFQEVVFHMPTCRWFSGLKELWLLRMSCVDKIKGLSNCSSLQCLTISHCSVSKIEGIEMLTHLERLHLQGNKIARIEGLDRCVNLRTLWLDDNRITCIEGLRDLHKLTDLSLAGNQIAKVGQSLDDCKELVRLNLAANLLGSFQEVLNLSRLQKLTHLTFGDPHHGENPVCHLANYQTYVLYNVPQIKSLDGLIVSETTKKLAEATYLKKKMYYNMRIKTLKRNYSNAIQKMRKMERDHTSKFEEKMDRICSQIADIKRAKHERACSNGGESLPNQAHAKLKKLEFARDRQRESVETFRRSRREIEKELANMIKEMVSRLVVELETGGNIRLEEGKTSDVWYRSCVELLKSRFTPSAFEHDDVTDLRVQRVTRIHNRFLRNRFEFRMASILSEQNERKDGASSKDGSNDAKRSQDKSIEKSESSASRSLEYLFFGETPLMSSTFGKGEELLRCIQEGFRRSEEYYEAGMDAGVCLSNSLAAIESPRVAIAKKAGRHVDGGKVIVAKVFLGECDDSSGVWQRSENRMHPSMLPKSYHSISSKIRTRDDDVSSTSCDESRAANVQKKWLFFDTALVLPEYLIEFEYVRGSDGGAADGKSEGDSTADEENSQSSKTTGPIIDLVNRFKFECLRFMKRQVVFDMRCKEATSAPCNFSQWPKLEIIDIGALSERKVDVDTLTTLNLHGSKLKTIGDLSRCAQLRTLILTFNFLRRLDGVEKLRALENLQVGYNLIDRMQAISLPSSLRELGLEGNILCEIDDISAVRDSSLPSLVSFDARRNPVCEVRGYRQMLLRWVPGLERIDDSKILPSFRKQFHLHPGCSIDLIRRCALTGQILRSRFADIVLNQGRRGSNPASPSYEDDAEEKSTVLYSTSSIAAVAMERRDNTKECADSDWWSKVVAIEMDRRGLTSLEHMSKLVNIRRATFRDNLLTTVAGSGIESCAELVEISIESNRLVDLNGLGSLRNLKTLEVGKNCISDLKPLRSAARLNQLSIEDNQISSLSELKHLTHLMELYIGNNHIAKLNEILHLKSLSKLIILDLSGNALTSVDQYRLYTVYNLRRLKVLDGEGVTVKELSQAREAFSGRLTVDFLVEKLGHDNFAFIRELDLSSCRIRLIERLSGIEFQNLEELNLNNNILTNLNGLQCLERLSVLRLNHNRISSLDSLRPQNSNSAGDDATTTEASAEWGFSAMGLKNLQVLHLGYNHIFDVSTLGLHGLTSLKVLNLEGNELTHLSGLEGMNQLQELCIDKNHIKHLNGGAFAKLPNLRLLRVEENGLRSVTALHTLCALQTLHIGYNRLSNFEVLDGIAEIPGLVELNIGHSSIARKQMYRQEVLRRVPGLHVLDGREVSVDERAHIESLLASETAPGAPTFVLDEEDASGVGMITGTGLSNYVVPKATPIASVQTFTAPSVSVLSLGLSNAGSSKLVVNPRYFPDRKRGRMGSRAVAPKVRRSQSMQVDRHIREMTLRRSASRYTSKSSSSMVRTMRSLGSKAANPTSPDKSNRDREIRNARSRWRQRFSARLRREI